MTRGFTDRWLLLMQGRIGGSLPSWLLPTPSPQRPEPGVQRKASPLYLRNKYYRELLTPTESVCCPHLGPLSR